MKKKILMLVALLAQATAFLTVNSACTLIIYEPQMPEDAEKLVI